MLKSWLTWLRSFGIKRAIDSLDDVEKPLAELLEGEKKKIEAMDTDALAKYLIDEIQYELKKKFNLLAVKEEDISHA